MGALEGEAGPVPAPPPPRSALVRGVCEGHRGLWLLTGVCSREVI